MSHIRILIADDHDLIRRGLVSALSDRPEWSIVAEAADGRQACEMAARLTPEIAVLDLTMPELNGLEATRQITKEKIPAKVLILSSYSDDEYIQQLTEAGATGYLIKKTAANDLINAIREVHKGNAFYSPSISKRLFDYYRQSTLEGKPVKRHNEQFTSRELEVLQLVAEGKVNKQIAADLCISPKTVEKHRQQVMNKLDIHEVAGLTRYAIAHGIIESLPKLSP